MATIVWVLIWIGCVQEGYRNHDLELLTSYRAKDMCSCVFVQERDEAYCRDWTVASPNLATLSVNVEAQTVSTEALQYWSATAVYMGTEVGCVLQ